MNESHLKTRRSGIAGVANIAWGEHLCFFYNGKQDLLDLVAPFIAAGLQDNEFCMWIIGGLVTESDALQALEAVSPQARQYVTDKRLEILPYHEWYLSLGAFNAESVLQGWAAKARDAESKGFAGMRITGNPFWLRSQEERNEFSSYEKTVEAAIQSERMLALCTYPLEPDSPVHVSQTLSTHGSALLNVGGEWRRLELCRPSL